MCVDPRFACLVAADRDCRRLHDAPPVGATQAILAAEEPTPRPEWVLIVEDHTDVMAPAVNRMLEARFGAVRMIELDVVDKHDRLIQHHQRRQDVTRERQPAGGACAIVDVAELGVGVRDQDLTAVAQSRGASPDRRIKQITLNQCPDIAPGFFMYLGVPVLHVTLPNCSYARVRVTLSCYTPDFADCASLLHSDWRDLRKPPVEPD